MLSIKVRYQVETGWPENLNLVQRVSAITRADRVSSFKIGITNDPVGRSYVYGDDYAEMIVVYRTSSDRQARMTEAFLVEQFKERADNDRAGGAGAHGSPPHYLYVVVNR